MEARKAGRQAREFGNKNADLFSDEFAHQRMSPSGVENRKSKGKEVKYSTVVEKTRVHPV